MKPVTSGSMSNVYKSVLFILWVHLTQFNRSHMKNIHKSFAARAHKMAAIIPVILYEIDIHQKMWHPSLIKWKLTIAAYPIHAISQAQAFCLLTQYNVAVLQSYKTLFGVPNKFPCSDCNAWSRQYLNY